LRIKTAGNSLQKVRAIPDQLGKPTRRTKKQQNVTEVATGLNPGSRKPYARFLRARDAGGKKEAEHRLTGGLQKIKISKKKRSCGSSRSALSASGLLADKNEQVGKTN